MGKIDFVIAWVDGSDPAWQKKKAEYTSHGKETGSEDGDAQLRYRDWGTLKYLFRSIERYAPWVHRVYLVTDAQVPAWLDTANPKVRVVDHKDFIPDAYLPTFNANTIELNIHRIPGLSEQFVFFNDDFLLTKKTRPEDFFYRGLPVDEAALNGINGRDPEFAGIQFSNMNLISLHYDRRAVLKNLTSWLRPQYGTANLRTLLLLPFQRLQGIYNPHGPMPLLKRTCAKLWERDREVLHKTCLNKERSRTDVSGYVFRYEQLLRAEFFPALSKNAYHDTAERTEDLEKALFDRRRISICLNDAPMSAGAYREKKKEITGLLERKYKGISTFEKNTAR